MADMSTALLGEICDVLDRRRKPITKKDRVPGPYPYYGATGILDYVEGYLFDEPLVLVGEDGAKWEAGENTAFAIDGKCWVNNHAHVLRPDRSRLLDSWLIYYLNQSDLMPFISGLTVPKLNQGKLREIPIPLPPLPEQERIVAILDEAFAAIATATANAEKNLANARELFESELNRVFSQKGDGWVEKELGEACEKVDYGHTASAKDTGGGPKFLRITDIQDGSVDWHSVPVCECEPDERKKYCLDRGDIVFARTGATTGKSYLIGDCPSDVIFASYLIRVRPKTPISSAYLAHFFKTPDYWEQISRSSSGSAQPGVNATKLKSLQVPIPPVLEQERIVSFIDDLAEQTRSLEAIWQQKLAALTALKQSILHTAFSGELTADGKAADRALLETGS